MMTRRTVLKTAALYGGGLMLTPSFGCGGGSKGSANTPLIADRSTPERYELAYTFADDGLLNGFAGDSALADGSLTLGVAASGDDVYLTLNRFAGESSIYRFAGQGRAGNASRSLILQDSRRIPNSPKAVSVSRDGLIYVPQSEADTSNARMSVFDNGGRLVRDFALSAASYTDQTAVGRSGIIHCSGKPLDFRGGLVNRFDSSGDYLERVYPTSRSYDPAAAPYHSAFSLDSAGNARVLTFTGQYSERGSRENGYDVLVFDTFDSTGTIKQTFPSPPIERPGAPFVSVLQSDDADNFYVNCTERIGNTLDADNRYFTGSYIRKFAPDGKELAAIRLDTATPESPAQETLYDFAVSPDGTIFAVVRSKDEASVAVRVYRRVA